MQVPQIRMQSQMAQIAIQTQPARQSIQQPEADLQIKQPLAEMNMRTTPGRLTIDQTQAWEDLNIKSVFKWGKEYAQKGHQAVMEKIAETVSEGDEMLDIHTGKNMYVEHARRHANPPPAEVNIAWIPSNFSVKINYRPGKTDININPNKPIINASIRKPVISYQPGDVNISLKQRNNLKIDFVK